MAQDRDSTLVHGARMLYVLAREACEHLYATRQRTLLALLGVAIGTAAVIAMINVGFNTAQESARQFKAMGPDLVSASITPRGGNEAASLALSDALSLARSVPGIAQVAPLAVSGSMIVAGDSRGELSVVGANASLNRIASVRVGSGRPLSPFDRFETFAVVGREAADMLGTPRRPLQTGDAIRIENYLFTVIGLLEDAIDSPLIPAELSKSVLVPVERFVHLFPQSGISHVVARVMPGADPAATAEALALHLQAKVQGAQIHAQSARQLGAAMDKQDHLLAMLLAGIGSISLLVGGIGVMNVMTMAVLERRREIGLRLAIGATRSDIGTMFVAEAAMLSLAGGAAGTCIGLMASRLVAWLSGWRFEWMTGTVPLGIGMAVCVGIASGLQPALRAARLHPVEALRSD